jgi:hypothetical protein
MELTAHPEYLAYRQHLDLHQRCRHALSDWKKGGTVLRVDEVALSWSYTQAQAFVGELSAFFEAYNQALFDKYPFCMACCGQCCMQGGAFVAAFDCLALGILEQPYPSLPERIDARVSDCIYRGAQGCLWPEGWRTFKCWLFYCPGGSTQPGFNLEAIAHALGLIAEARLPEPLRRFQPAAGMDLASRLSDPLAFAEGIGESLDRMFVRPLNSAYPFLVDEQPSTFYKSSQAPQETFFCTDAAWSAFVQEVSAHLDKIYNWSEEFTSAQCLADLEVLEWIRLGQPGHALKLLEEMYGRYSSPPNGLNLNCGWVFEAMRQQILRLMKVVGEPASLF